MVLIHRFKYFGLFSLAIIILVLLAYILVLNKEQPNDEPVEEEIKQLEEGIPLIVLESAIALKDY